KMMLKSMREATPQDSMMDSDQTRMFTGMLDQQLAQSMSTRGIGLADMMVRQLGRSGQALPPALHSETGASAPWFRGNAPAASVLHSETGASAPLFRGNALAASVLSPQSFTQQLGAQPLSCAGNAPHSAAGTFSAVVAREGPSGIAASILDPKAVPSAFNATTQQDFVSKMLPHAMQASGASGVPPQLMLGQAALESGWGKREIHMADGSNSFNLFGIKANAGWHGKVAEVMTTEYTNGVAHKQVEKFRAYSSYAEAFKDYAGMMSSNPRYANVLQQAGSPSGMAQALQKSGYATDPKYAEKLVSVMKQMNIAG
ncbi:MAG: flagellar assembly peptidoglycan hydrolase FlgJ, partial [Gallionella sp.]|nr:flagellar assembly peptidoglycan hydrolase FlgJ [Gallionella sp.]